MESLNRVLSEDASGMSGVFGDEVQCEKLEWLYGAARAEIRRSMVFAYSEYRGKEKRRVKRWA